MSDNEEKPKFSFYILRKNIFTVPCFKETMVYSFSSYIGVGLLTFLFTSRPAFSSHCGFASYMLVTFGYFTHCRLKYRDERLLADQYDAAVRSDSLQLVDTQEENNKDDKSKTVVLEEA